jgi:phospholipase D1/2
MLCAPAIQQATRSEPEPGPAPPASSRGARRILVPGRNCWRQVAADGSGVIVDAADYYRAFYAAAERARRYILVSGWQFDRGVQLLRGTHAVGLGARVKLVKFLDHLCTRTPALRVYLLAWNFNMVFAMEREWMQRLWFHYATNERMIFRFDDADANSACHHQKFAVIDGLQSFVGGIDLCEARWDERDHRSVNQLRRSRGNLVKPYHDVQAQLQGPVVGAALRDLFVDRWGRSGGRDRIDPSVLLDPAVETDADRAQVPWPPAPEVPHIGLGPATVSLARTDPRGKDETIREVEHLFVDAIAAADRLIYIETQYFSSTRIRRALLERMRAADRARLQIVIVVNERAEAFKEEVAVGLRQAKNIARLRQVAAGTGHALGVYYSLSDGAGEAQRATYIHSKLMLVDDRFLTIGSANLTNRSMEVDSELHVAWESAADDRSRVGRGIRRLRVSLLAEHAGLAGPTAIRPLVAIDGLVDRLNQLAGQAGARLQIHGPPRPAQQTAMSIIDPEDLPFDPARAQYPDGEAAPDEDDDREDDDSYEAIAEQGA